MRRGPRVPPRSELRIVDLKRRRPTPTKLLNVKIAEEVGDAISRIAEHVGASKTEVVVALLNIGFERFSQKHK